MGYLDDLTGKDIFVEGVRLPSRKNIRFTGNITGTDNPATNSTDINLSPESDEGTGNGVTKVFGRDGLVEAKSGDYTASQVAFSPLSSPLTSVNAQAAIVEVYNELTNSVSNATSFVANKTVSGAGYEIQSSDQGTLLRSVGATDVAFQVSEASSPYESGTVIHISREGTGKCIVIPGADTTIHTARFATNELAGQWSDAVLTKRAPGVWVLSGDLKEERPLIQFVPDGGVTTTESGAFPLDTSKTFAQGGFSVSSANSEIVAPVSGWYRVEFNFHVAVASGPPDQYFPIINTDGAPYNNYATVQNIEDSSFAGERRLNWTQMVRVINAGSKIRLSIDSTGGSYTPDGSSDRQICSITWICD